MSLKDALEKEGRIVLGGDDLAAMSIVGKRIPNFWLHTTYEKVIKDSEGVIAKVERKVSEKTAKVDNLKEIAEKIYVDGWIPTEPISDEFILELENSLRGNQKLADEGRQIPDAPFLVIPDKVEFEENKGQDLSEAELNSMRARLR